MSPFYRTSLILTSEQEAGMPIGEKIQTLRTAKGWSQDDLAKKLGTKAPNVSRWENGHTLPATETLKQLGELFEVSVDYLLYDKTPFKPLVGFKDDELLEQFTQIDQLDDSARAALKRFLRALTAEQKVREALGHAK